MDMFRNLFINLQNHIDVLAEEVKFLREDSISKSRMKNNLIDIAGIRYKKCESNNYSTNSDDSSCDDVTKYNVDMSKNDHNASVEGSHVVILEVKRILEDLSSTPILRNTDNQKDGKNQQQYFQFPPIEEEGDNEIIYEDNTSGNNYWLNVGKSSEVPNKVESNITILNTIYPVDTKAMWNDGTSLIIGDSMLYGIEESRLKCSKVCVYPGASVDDMFFNIFPFLRKNSTNIIMHAGTNNVVTENSFQIIRKLLKLKHFIISILLSSKLVFSQL